MTKLLITEKLITTKREFTDFSNLPDSVDFIKYEDFTSNTTLSLFTENQAKFIYDKYVTYSELVSNDYNFSSDFIFQIKKNNLSKFSEVSSDIEVIHGSNHNSVDYLPWDLSNLIFNKKDFLTFHIMSEFCENENLFRQFISYLNKELSRVNLLIDNDLANTSKLFSEKTDYKYELANRRLQNISKENLEKSFEQIHKIEKLMNQTGFNQENAKRFVVGIKKLLEF